MKRYILQMSVVSVLLLCAPVSDAARSLSRVNQTWETLMGNRLVLTYFSLGVLGDLYRAKVYSKAKSRRYLLMVQGLLREEKDFLSSLKSPGGKANRRLFRKIRATVDLMYLASKALYAGVGGDASELKQFLVYRNSIAVDVSKILGDPALKKKRYYRGGWRAGLRALGHYAGADVALGFLVTGLVADGYFRLLLSKAKVFEYLGTTYQLMLASGRGMRSVGGSVPAGDRMFVSGWKQAAVQVMRVGMALKKFVHTRDRKFLAEYRQWRGRAWGMLVRLGS